MKKLRIFRFAAVVALVTMAIQVQAQQRGLRLYNSITYRQTIPSTGTAVQEFRAISPSVAFFWSGASSVTQEVELTNIWHSSGRQIDANQSPTATTRQSNLGVGARYEVILPMFSKNTESRVKGGLGFGALVQVYGSRYQPGVTTSFPSRFLVAAIRPSITPRVTWWMSERLGLDFSLPVALMSYTFEHNRIDSPDLPVAQRSIATSTFTLAPAEIQLRLGLAFLL